MGRGVSPVCIGSCVFAHQGEQWAPFLPLLLSENLAKGPRSSGTGRGLGNKDPREGNNKGHGIKFVEERLKQ